MSEVLIRCPVSGRDIHTGLAMSGPVFTKATLPTSTIRCPHCGMEHTWSKENAFLQFPPEREPPNQ